MNSLITAFRSLIRNISMTLASLSLITVTLVIFGLFLAIAANVDNSAEEINSKLTITAYTEQGVILSEEELTTIENEIYAINGVDEVGFSSQQDELEHLAELYDDDSFIETFQEDNPLSNVFSVTVEDLSVDITDVSEEIAKIDGINLTDDGSDGGLEQFQEALKSIQTIMFIATIIFLVIVIFLISTTVRMAITARRKEIAIMRLVGATKFLIQQPFIVEGMIIGFIGGILSGIISYYIYIQINSETLLRYVFPTLLSINDVAIYFILLPIMGILVGMLSSLIAIRKNLKI